MEKKFKLELDNKVRNYIDLETKSRNQADEIINFMYENGFNEFPEDNLCQLVGSVLCDFVNNKLDPNVATDNLLEIYEIEKKLSDSEPGSEERKKLIRKQNRLEGSKKDYI